MKVATYLMLLMLLICSFFLALTASLDFRVFAFNSLWSSIEKASVDSISVEQSAKMSEILFGGESVSNVLRYASDDGLLKDAAIDEKTNKALVAALARLSFRSKMNVEKLIFSPVLGEIVATEFPLSEFYIFDNSGTQIVRIGFSPHPYDNKVAVQWTEKLPLNKGKEAVYYSKELYDILAEIEKTL